MLQVSDEELTRKNFAIGMCAFGIETYTAVMNYIWPGCDDAIGNLRVMINVCAHTDQRRQGARSDAAVGKLSGHVQRRLSVLGMLGVHSIVHGRTVLIMRSHRHRSIPRGMKSRLKSRVPSAPHA
jgi:hypothetical protein